MARNSETTRQWQVLRDIDAARTGITIPKLAAARGVHQRTIRRDLDALASAGFPLYDEKINGTTMWKLRARPFRTLEEMGLSLMELCALYFSRAMLASMAGAPYQDDAARAFEKIARALPPGCRRFLDNLPVAIKAKFSGRKKGDERKLREVVNRATDALLQQRRLAMRYDSRASCRSKDYIVEPLRISYADGGTYLTAYVPEYREVRHFAFERVRTLGVTDEKFIPRPLPAEPFANSLGVFSGPAECVELEFDASIAHHLTTREWHKSQTFDMRPDGSGVMRLEVCIDPPLTMWLLGLGGAVRVVSPLRLAQEVLEQIEQARGRYVARRRTFEMLSLPPELGVRPRRLPLRFGPQGRAS
jgi:predicted DNA-binding transcriptional regulator YafY